METLRALAAKYNFSLIPKDSLLRELGYGIAKRMVKRRGNDVYQMLGFNLPYFPRELLKEIFPTSSVSEESPKQMCWVLATHQELNSLSPLLQKSCCVCAGLTKAFQSASERVIRVVAKLMPPFEITHEVSGMGAEKCFLNGMYLLATEAGELHMPKGNNRRELEVPMQTCQELRKGVREDVLLLGQQGASLSPGWWRHLGDEERARSAEEALANSSINRRTRVRTRRAASTESFEIEAIVSEEMRGRSKMYLVRWAGYEASWEPWRINGQPGEPIETWEPAHLVKNTEALEAWIERTHSD